MKKHIYMGLLCISLSYTAHAQGHLPDVNFSGSNICDNSPWQLVFYDDFNGTALDRSKWRSYKAWDGMTDGDNDDYGDGRLGDGFVSIIKDENVVVSGGTCKLILKHDPSSWHCNTCSMSTIYSNYSTGFISTYYHKNGIGNQYFDAPLKVEARIRMPNSQKMHSTFWTWNGAGIDEVDIAEAYGDPYWPTGLPGNNNRYCDYSTHAWAPQPIDSNYYHLVDVEYPNPSGFKYPHQRWWDYVTGNYFQQNDWHTYGIEWDTARIDFYLDGTKENSIFKYFYVKNVPVPRTTPIFPRTVQMMIPASTCNPTGTYKVLQGFPWKTYSQSTLILSTGLDQDIYTSPGIYNIDQMEIDYVKAWEKHPEVEGHANICSGPSASTISGPDIICGNTSNVCYWLS